jgi:adenylate cyclase class IV
MKFREIELKYDASNIALSAFKHLIEAKGNIRKNLLVSSYDDYFVDSSGNFLRYRHKEGRGELTIKRKLSDQNNNQRVEVNVPTDGNNLPTITQFAGLLGYKHNFCVYKTCQVYWIDNVVVVYYVVYNDEWIEQRRFIEIEADEDLSWESEAHALKAVEDWEKVLAPLGIKPQNRLKKSLFEIFKKD